MPSTVPRARNGVVANGLANTCLGPFVRAVPGAPQSKSELVSIEQPSPGPNPAFATSPGCSPVLFIPQLLTLGKLAKRSKRPGAGRKSRGASP